jgi:hypothetical protein
VTVSIGLKRAAEQATMTPFDGRRIARAAILLGTPLLLCGCPHPTPVQSLYPTLRDTLGPAWMLVPLPNTALAPGTVVQVTAADGKPLTQASRIDIQRLGSLQQDCKVPSTALQVVDSAVPAISQGSTYSLDASIGANIAKIASIDLSANAGSTVDFTIKAATDSTLDFIALTNWATDPANAVLINQACRSTFALPNVYVVQEAFVVSDATYTFKDSNGAKISVTPPPNVPVHGSIGGSSDNNGGLTVTAPTVFALKVLQPVPEGGFHIAAIATGVSPHESLLAPPPPPPPQPLDLSGKTINAIQGVKP